MMEKKDFHKQSNSMETINMSSNRFYEDLDNAIEKRDKSNIYRLSKIITQYHLFQD